MQDRPAADHDAVTIDQFTKQAGPFASLHTARTDADILRLIRDAARVGAGSRVLDVACGPGLVALHLAEAAGRVTGLDLTPAMLDKARELQRERGMENLSWDLGRADALPYPDASFDAVVTRFSFHHLVDPAKALAEMVRTCRPGGRVVVCDVYTTTPEQAAEYDRLERLRDPSHVHALRLEELRALMADASLDDRDRGVRPPADGPGSAAGGLVPRPRRGRRDPAGVRRRHRAGLPESGRPQRRARGSPSRSRSSCWPGRGGIDRGSRPTPAWLLRCTGPRRTSMTRRTTAAAVLLALASLAVAASSGRSAAKRDYRAAMREFVQAISAAGQEGRPGVPRRAAGRHRPADRQRQAAASRPTTSRPSTASARRKSSTATTTRTTARRRRRRPTPS